MLINVQFLRMVAAMLVVFYHTSAHVRSAGAEQGVFFAINDAIGFAGVDIFFVISGFIMAHTSFSAAGWADGWSFLRRRLARIYSGYWPFFLLALVLFAWVDLQFLKDARLVRSAILWPAWPQLIAVSWTLTFEMFFYLLFTLVIALTGQLRRGLLWLLLLLMAAFTSYSEFVRHAYAPGSLEYLGVAEHYMLSPYLLEFLGGALVAFRMHTAAPARRAAWGSLMLLLGSVAFLSGGWINLHYFDGGIEQGYSVFWRVLVFGLPSLLIIAGLVRLDQAGIRAPARFSLMTGGASYAIYLSHTLILIGLQKLGFNEFATSIGGLKMQWLYIGLTLAILGYSVLHYRLIERPLHRRFKRWLRVG